MKKYPYRYAATSLLKYKYNTMRFTRPVTEEFYLYTIYVFP